MAKFGFVLNQENPNTKNICVMEIPKYFCLKIPTWPYENEAFWPSYVILDHTKCYPKINQKGNFPFCLWILSKFFHWKFYEKCNVPINHFSFNKSIFSNEKLFKCSFLLALTALTCWKKLWEFLGDNCFNHSASQLIIMSSLSRGKSLLTWGVTGNSQVLCAFEKSSGLIEFLNIAFFFPPLPPVLEAEWY